MSRRARTVLVVVCLAAAAIASAPGSGSAARAPSRLLVTASEWSFVLSRPKLPPGPAILQMYNRGEDAHNLRIRPASGGPVRRIGEVGPGETGRLDLRLRRGKRYRLWCALPNHRGLGMKATLKVARRR